ncbi:MAG: hypothetical protein KC713_03415, partial [Candidatus Omnitrophica bacterium]|nr:hypothetical protein [Candidatus Omnitrophota bacterium]
MKNSKFIATIGLIAILAVGCGQKPTTNNANEAIEKAKSQPSVEAQVDFLVKEANAFVNSEKFDDAIKTAKHVLADLDKESQAAQEIINRATEELKKAAEAKIDEAKQEANKKMDEM